MTPGARAANASAMTGAPTTRASFDPDPATWAELVREPPTGDVATETRHQLALPTDRPVVMGGHQPGLWHAGILAKWFATEALARSIGAQPAWVVVDQSPGQDPTIRYPSSTDGALSTRVLGMGLTQPPPPAARGALSPPAPPIDPALPSVALGLDRARELLAAHAGASTFADQLHGACVDAIVRALGADTTVTSFGATTLCHTEAHRTLLGAIRRDPDACAHWYNVAAEKHPNAGVRQLATRRSGVELPLWERRDDGDWRTTTSDRLADLPDEALVPRGIPMTGMVRRWACDLFIHGTGGGATGSETGYDRITEDWFSNWLGEAPDQMAPAVVATATMRLDFEGSRWADDVPSIASIHEAQAQAHRALHNPSLLGDTRAGEAKHALVERIARAPRRSVERATLFREMHDLRRATVERHSAKLDAKRARAETLAGRAASASIIEDRTWPFLLHSTESLHSLRDEIVRRLSD